MIYIVDDIMGSGKTTWAFRYMNEHRGTRFLCVVPTLDECKRYKDKLWIKLIEPKKWGSKYQNFLTLLNAGESIVTTHSLISRMDTEAMQILREMDYTLIIDEALEVLSPYRKLSIDDKEMIFNQKRASLDEDGYITWSDDDYDGAFNDMKRLCENKALMTYKNSSGELAQPFMWNFPSDFFKCFEKSFILTYMWDGSIQKSYFNIHGIDYKKMMLDENNWSLIKHDRSLEMMKRKKVASLINICDNPKMNRIGEKIGRAMPLSKNWYRRQEKEKKDGNKVNGLEVIKRNAENFFREYPSTDNMYTCFDSMKSKVSGRKFTGTKKNPCFVPCNARGTNNFSHKKNLAYLINFFLPADIKKFINYYKFEFDEDQYSLSVLLQWIWRSKIRKGQPINIYIPSERMRGLLTEWINESMKYPTIESKDKRIG